MTGRRLPQCNKSIETDDCAAADKAVCEPAHAEAHLRELARALGRQAARETLETTKSGSNCFLNLTQRTRADDGKG